MSPLLEVRGLSVVFDTPQGEVHAVREASFSLEPGQVLAIVGESGCGKSALCRAVMGLLPANGRITGGQVLREGEDLVQAGERRLRALRGRFLSLMPQSPMTALDPTQTVGRQIGETVRLHNPKLSRAGRKARAAELLGLVRLDPRVEGQYPHQLSGGMRQRAVLAVALAGEPRILLADEPTTALDVTVQAQILLLLDQLRQRLGMALVLVSHDLGVVARLADCIAVMAQGRVVESGTAEEIFYHPRHPCTRKLLLGSMDTVTKGCGGSRRLGL